MSCATSSWLLTRPYPQQASQCAWSTCAAWCQITHCVCHPKQAVFATGLPNACHTHTSTGSHACYCKAECSSYCIGTGCKSSSCQTHHPSCRGSRASMPFTVPMPPLSWPCWRPCKGWMLPTCLLCLPSCRASNALLMLQKADSLLTQQVELICKVSDLLATPPLQVELESQLS